MKKLRSQENTCLEIELYIMKAWQTSEDLNAILHAMEGLSEDERESAILGVKILHEIRMRDLNRVFCQFEQSLEQKKNNS